MKLMTRSRKVLATSDCCFIFPLAAQFGSTTAWSSAELKIITNIQSHGFDILKHFDKRLRRIVIKLLLFQFQFKWIGVIQSTSQRNSATIILISTGMIIYFCFQDLCKKAHYLMTEIIHLWFFNSLHSAIINDFHNSLRIFELRYEFNRSVMNETK